MSIVRPHFVRDPLDDTLPVNCNAPSGSTGNLNFCYRSTDGRSFTVGGKGARSTVEVLIFSDLAAATDDSLVSGADFAQMAFERVV